MVYKGKVNDTWNEDEMAKNEALYQKYDERVLGGKVINYDETFEK